MQEDVYVGVRVSFTAPLYGMCMYMCEYERGKCMSVEVVECMQVCLRMYVYTLEYYIPIVCM